MKFTKPFLAAYVYACLDGNRVAASPLSAAGSTFEESPTFRRRMVGSEVTCIFRIDNYLTGIWVDGVDKKETGNYNSQSENILKFDDSAVSLAIAGSDREKGCKTGGFRITCSSENTSSKWNMNNRENRLDWLVSSKRGSYKNLVEDSNGKKWYQPGYITAAEFSVPNQVIDGYMCGGSNNENHWQFRFELFFTSSPTTSQTNLPTSSPSSSPTSLPTTSPTSSPSTSPTSSPTSSPTMTPPKQNSWYIANNGNATEEATSKDLITISLPFNSTNRDKDALVFMKDCVTAFPPNFFKADTTPPTSLQADGYIQFNTMLVMNVTAINRTNYWTPYVDGTRGGWVEVCTETYLRFKDDSDLGNGPEKTKVDFKINILNISVSLTANYEVDEVSAQREEATKRDVNTDYSKFITAYECDGTDFNKKKAATTYNQGDEITICVTDKSDDIVQVEEFVDLVVAQSGINDYNFILNGQWNSDITTPVCVVSNTSNRRICYATIRALARFFSAETPLDLTIRGSVYVRRDGRRVRQTIRSALPATENENEEDALYGSSRRVQENPGSGEFEIKVVLTSTDNSAASACTVRSRVAVLMSVVVGAAGVTGAALMV